MKSTRKNRLVHKSNTTRKCTHTRWFVLFIIIWILLVLLGSLAIQYGNYLTLIKGYDSFGNLCGVRDNQPFKNFTLSGTDTSTKSNLYYFGYGNLSNILTLCVESCNNKVLYSMKDIYEFYKSNKTSLCRYDFNYSLLENDPQADDFSSLFGPCARVRLDESTAVKHRCLPDIAVYIFSSGTYEKLNLGFSKIQVFFSYIYLTWKYIVALGCFALYIAGLLLFMIWLHGQVQPSFIGLLCFTTSVALNSGICYVYLHFPTEFDDYLNLSAVKFRKFPTFIEDFQINEYALYAFHAICLLITEALITFLIVLRKYIDSATIVLKEAVKCCKEVPQLVYLSLIATVILGGCYSLFSYIILCSSAGTKKRIVPFAYTESQLGNLQYSHMRQLEKVIFVDINFVQNSTWIIIFGFLWTAEFILACEQFCLETLATQWFWRAQTKPTLLSIIWTLIKYHLGSAARRSFLALFKIPRMTLLFLCQSRIGAGFEACERFVRPPFHDVYGFEVGYRKASHSQIGSVESLIMEAKREKLDGVRSVISFTFLLARVSVVNVTSLLGIFLMQGQEDLYLFMCPVILSSILALYIAHIVISVIETPMATILFCILESRTVSGNRKRLAERNSEGQGVIMVVDQIIEEDGGAEHFVTKSQKK